MDEQRRALVLSRVAAGKTSVGQAALLLGLSDRQAWRLKSRLLAADLDPASLVQGNRGRAARTVSIRPLPHASWPFAQDG